MSHETEVRAQELRARYARSAAESPKARIRQHAERMNVSELELVLAHCGRIRCVQLQGPVQPLFRQLGDLGRVMALSRNPWCVHERQGRYEEIRTGQTMGIVLGPDIDLRLFFDHWKTAVAVDDGGRQSIQFFDAGGGALHKVYRIADTDEGAWAAFVEKNRKADQDWPDLSAPAAPDETVDEAPPELREEWLAMDDTHQFFPLLRRLKLSRLTALRSAGSDLAQLVPNDTIERMLHTVSETALPIMCFVGNRGIVQIHSGPVRKLLRTGPWFNVLDPDFNLHLDTTAIEQTWIVNKPTRDGWLTSLEGFSRDGDLIVQFYGARKPGIPELAPWRKLLTGYCAAPLAA